ncbi:MAG: DUF881 domain-containing protein [Clostridia bacterium]
MRTKTGQVALMAVSIILGVMLAAQFKNVQRVGGSVSLQRTQELTNRVEQLQYDNEGLREQIVQLQEKIQEYELAAQDSGKITETMLDDLQNARMAAGLVDVVGQGIVVKINHLYYTDEFNNKKVFQTVMDEDLLKIVNELNASGAEAIAVNDERLIATSEIRNAGKYININTNSYSVPFRIAAIGDPETLEAGLKLNGGVIDSMSPYYDITISREDKLIIPKYKGVLKFHYARPVKEGK